MDMEVYAHCNATITKDNVNQIPADWNIENDNWRYSVSMPFLIQRCKEAKLGFLPFTLVKGISVFKWFIETWGSYVDVNAEFPYPWLCERSITMASDTKYQYGGWHSSLLFCYYNLKFVSASLLIKAGAKIRKEDFLSFARALDLTVVEDMHKEIAYMYLDSGKADYRWRGWKSSHGGNSWLTQQCRIYTERIERCSRATVVLGGILRRQRRIYDKFLIRDMMRVVWNTRVSPDWGDQ
jgi:hypothetical protein